MSRKASLRWLLGGVIGLLCASGLQAAPVLLSGEDSPAARAFSLALAQQRPQDQVQFVSLDQLKRAPSLEPDTRLVLFGENALAWRLALPQAPPTLVLRVSRVQAQSHLGTVRPNGLSLLWSDPPPARQLQLAHLLVPQATRIGVLHDEHSRFLLDELRQAAKPMGLTIVAQSWPDTRDTRPLLALLKQSDLLLGLDDTDLFNPQTVKSLLLTSYAQERALLGPSAAFVKAGSLASSYSDQADWLTTLDRLLDQDPRHWPAELYPSHFKVLGNRQVARALGIRLDTDTDLARQLTAGEQTP
ncbi:MAG: ABC transporter substrate-binding protein [Pseudomonas sp.]|uniref:ABC transporter substrate-binding protein n=1 Tax=Pseudomonas sp. TaxID=306 RepID=UPI003395444A